MSHSLRHLQSAVVPVPQSIGKTVITMALTSSIPTGSLPVTALYSGAGGILFATLSLRVFIYRLSKGSKAFFGDQNIPAAPKLQSIVRVRLHSCVCSISPLYYRTVGTHFILCSPKPTWLSTMLLSLYCLPFWSSIRMPAPQPFMVWDFCKSSIFCWHATSAVQVLSVK